MKECKDCKGKGKTIVGIRCFGSDSGYIYEDCFTCDGTGVE